MTAGNMGSDRVATDVSPGPAGEAAPRPAAGPDSQPVPLSWGEGTPDPGRRWPPDTGLPLGARPARNAVVGAGLLGYAWLLAGSAPFSTRALIGVLLPGAVLGVVAVTRPPERIPPPDSVDVTGFSYWVICIALLFEWEASAVRDNASGWHPALTDLVNPLITPHPVRAAAIVIWLLAGWALVKR